MDVSLNLKDTLRESKPQETLKRLKPLFPCLGITRIANITHFDHFMGVYVACAIRPNSKNLSISIGKGTNLELAMISAIMEGVEAYHLETNLKTKVSGNYKALSNKYKIAAPSKFNLGMCQVELEDMHLDWIEAHDLMTNATVLVPKALTSIDTTKQKKEYLYSICK